MSANPANRELTEQFIDFYRNYYRQEIGDLAQQYPKEKRSLYIDYRDLYNFDPGLTDDYAEKPGQYQKYAEEALRNFDLPADVKLGQAHVRVTILPETTDIRDIRVNDDHIGTLIAVQGIVRKATDVRPQITEAAFECQRCGTMTYIPQGDGGFQEPHECQGCERQGPFRTEFDQSNFIDSQKIRVQESPEGLRGGETPQSIDINLADDITGKVTAGDHVTVTGILHIEQQSSGNQKTPIFDYYMEGVSLSIEDEDFEEMEITDDDVAKIRELSNEPDIYEQMVDSVAPSIFGYDGKKLAMILQLFSGITKHLPDGTRIRGDLHMLFIGDPGTAKSQLIQYVDMIAPRSVYTSGKGSSAAGLTASAVRDDFSDGQQWTLEAGALVLADKGIAAIDELDKMRPEDRSASHEALEQQQISVSKAGINATLKSRCSVIGAANPKYGRFDRYEPIGEQIDLEPALISRFDLIFTFIDEPDRDHDSKLARHILKTNRAGEMRAHEQSVDRPAISNGDVDEATEDVDPEIDPDLLRKYIAYAKSNCYPMLTDEAEDILHDFYVDFRALGADEDAPVPVTARKLEALVRLSEASARARLSDKVTAEDAERVVGLVESSLQDVGMDPETEQYDVDIVETGTSKSQRDRISDIRELIVDIQPDEGGLPLGKLADVAEEEHGYSRKVVTDTAEKLVDKGDAYRPGGPGTIRTWSQ